MRGAKRGYGFEVLPGVSSRRAFLKIQEGATSIAATALFLCPWTNQEPSSRKGEEAVEICSKGYKEVVLRNPPGSIRADLSEGLTCRVLEMITRFLVLRGRASVPWSRWGHDELLAVMAQSPKACPHLHIPQSGSITF